MARLFAFAIVIAITTYLSSPAATEGVFIVGNTQFSPAALLNDNHPTTAEAISAGLTQCRREGFLNCRVVATFRNECYAYAFSNTPGGWGGAGGATAQAARRNAIAACQRHNPGAACYAHDSTCDTVSEQDTIRAREEHAREEEERRTRAREEQANEEKERRTRAREQQARQEEQRRAEQEARAQRQAQLDEQNARLARIREEDEQSVRRLKADISFCFQGDHFACNRALINPVIGIDDHRRIEQKKKDLLANQASPSINTTQAIPSAPSSSPNTTEEQLLVACEHYDLAACQRISRTPLADLGTGLSASLDEKSKRIGRFNRALSEAQTFDTYVKECAQKKRTACDAALLMPAISKERRVHITQLQASLPIYSLDDPKHFLATIVAVPFLGILAFIFFSRRSPANSPYLADYDAPRPLDRAFIALQRRGLPLLSSFFIALRLRIARAIAPSALRAQTDNAGSSPRPSSTSEAPRDPIAAQSALRIAYSYLGELPDGLASAVLENPDSAKSYRATLALAAKQLDIAQRADPTAKLVVEDAERLPTVFTQQRLRARIVLFEAYTWSIESPRKEIRLTAQAIQIDPEYALAHFSLGLAHFLNHNRAQAIASLEKALALDPGNIDIVKYLDRARNMSDAEIATFKLSNAAAKTTAAGIKTWNVMRIVWIFGLPIAILIAIASFTGSVGQAFSVMVAFAVCAPIVTWILRLMNRY